MSTSILKQLHPNIPEADSAKVFYEPIALKNPEIRFSEKQAEMPVGPISECDACVVTLAKPSVPKPPNRAVPRVSNLFARPRL
jgi:hypothetical protein